MILNINLIVLIFILNIKNIFADNKDGEIHFISDFLDVEFHAVRVTAFLCWEKNDTLNLSQKLFDNDIRIRIIDMSVDKVPYYQPTPDTLYLLDANCNESYSILLLANETNYFATPYKWFLLTDDFETYSEDYNLKNLSILIDSYFYIGEKISEDEYQLNEIYKYNKTSPLVNQPIANWTTADGFINHSSPTILSDRRRNLMGTKLIAAAVILDNDTFHHLWDYRNIETDSITKLNIRLVKTLMQFLNASEGFEYYDSWGYKKPSETIYTGMIGAMQHGNAELGSTSLFVNTERIRVIDYLSWTTPTYIQFVYLQPPLSYVTNLFTLPFTRTVWFSILGLFFLSIIMIYFITLWERRNIKDKKVEDDSFLEVIMLAVGAVCQQGTTYEPKSGTGQIITFLIFIALLFIYTSYSAYIVVLLQSSSDQIQTLEDLLNSQMDYGLVDIVYNHFYFENATEPIRQAIYERKIKPKGDHVFMDLEEGVRRLRKGFFAFHGETPPIYTLIGKTFLESEKCGLQNLQYIEATQFWLPVKKKSSYKEVFKVCLRRLHETGIQSRESRLILQQKPMCLGGGNSFVSVGLIDAGPAFYFLAAGFGFAIFVFILEHAMHRVNCNQLNKKLKQKITKKR